MMELIDRVVESLKEHEGFVPHAYRDSLGYLTIGYGRLIDERKGGGITHAEAEVLLANDVSRAVAEANSLDWARDLDPARKAVIVELIFNMGKPNLLGFRRMIAAIRRGDFKTAAAELLDSRWARQVGERRSGNLARRLERAEG